ncbi:MAG: hypothetical protein ACLRZ2_04025 [Veillonella sp.]
MKQFVLTGWMYRYRSWRWYENSEESSSHHFHNFTPWENHPIVGTSDKSKSTELNKLYIETLQPITHYDENAKVLSLYKVVLDAVEKRYPLIN